MLIASDPLEELKQKVRVGLAQLDAGQSVVFDQDTLKGIKQRGRERLAESDTEARPIEVVRVVSGYRDIRELLR
jgi:hypothetical protein